MTAAKPLARYGAIERRARERLPNRPSYTIQWDTAARIKTHPCRVQPAHLQSRTKQRLAQTALVAAGGFESDDDAGRSAERGKPVDQRLPAIRIIAEAFRRLLALDPDVERGLRHVDADKKERKCHDPQIPALHVRGTTPIELFG